MAFEGLSGEFLVLFGLVLLVTGVVAGVLAGLLGVGGGIVIVPVLFHLLTALGVDESVRMHVAVGTSLATIIPTSIRSVLSHHKKGAVDWSVLRAWALPMFVGVVAGSLLADYVSGEVLTLIFAVTALIVAANMAFGREGWRLAERLPAGPAKHGIASGIGLLSTLMGIGGGTFGVPIMKLFGVPIHRAVGTAAGFGFIISVPGTIGFILAGLDVPLRPALSLGFVNLLGFALIIPATILSAPIGVALAHRMAKETLTRAFALFLAITSIRMFLEILG